MTSIAKTNLPGGGYRPGDPFTSGDVGGAWQVYCGDTPELYHVSDYDVSDSGEYVAAVTSARDVLIMDGDLRLIASATIPCDIYPSGEYGKISGGMRGVQCTNNGCVYFRATYKDGPEHHDRTTYQFKFKLVGDELTEVWRIDGGFGAPIYIVDRIDDSRLYRGGIQSVDPDNPDTILASTYIDSFAGSSSGGQLSLIGDYLYAYNDRDHIATVVNASTLQMLGQYTEAKAIIIADSAYVVSTGGGCSGYTIGSGAKMWSSTYSGETAVSGGGAFSHGASLNYALFTSRVVSGSRRLIVIDALTGAIKYKDFKRLRVLGASDAGVVLDGAVDDESEGVMEYSLITDEISTPKYWPYQGPRAHRWARGGFYTYIKGEIGGTPLYRVSWNGAITRRRHVSHSN